MALEKMLHLPFHLFAARCRELRLSELTHLYDLLVEKHPWLRSNMILATPDQMPVLARIHAMSDAARDIFRLANEGSIHCRVQLARATRSELWIAIKSGAIEHFTKRALELDRAMKDFHNRIMEEIPKSSSKCCPANWWEFSPTDLTYSLLMLYAEQCPSRSEIESLDARNCARCLDRLCWEWARRYFIRAYAIDPELIPHHELSEMDNDDLCEWYGFLITRMNAEDDR